MPRGRAVAGLFAVFVVLWAGTALRAFSLWIGAFDLGFFVQALGTVALHGPFAEIPMLGVSFLGDHFSPLLIPIAPLTLLPGAPYWLLGVQAMAVAAATVVVWRMFSPSKHSAATAAIFAASPAVLYAVWNDFHASTVALPFLALFALGVTEQRVGLATTGAVLTALLREDVALQVGILATYICLRWWRPAVWAAIAGLAVGLGYPLGGGGTGWLTGAGFAYLEGKAWYEVPGSVVSVVWGGGGILPLILAVIGPWLIVGRPRWGIWGAYFVSVLPFLALSPPSARTVGSHYYVASAVVGALSIVGRMRSRPTFLRAVAAILVLVGPFGLPGVVVFRDAWEKRVRNTTLQELAAGVSAGPVSVVQPLVAFVDPRVDVYPWPAPHRDYVLPNITPVPIIDADPDVRPILVLAPRDPFDFFGPEVTPADEQNLQLREVGEISGIVVFEVGNPE